MLKGHLDAGSNVGFETINWGWPKQSEVSDEQKIMARDFTRRHVDDEAFSLILDMLGL
jgi:hypothetical protein